MLEAIREAMAWMLRSVDIMAIYSSELKPIENGFRLLSRGMLEIITIRI